MHRKGLIEIRNKISSQWGTIAIFYGYCSCVIKMHLKLQIKHFRKSLLLFLLHMSQMIFWNIPIKCLEV